MDERDRLIEILNSQGISAKQFAQKLGISAGTLSNIIGGRNKPSLELLKSIATHYPFIKSDWLFLGKGEMYTPDYEPPISQSPSEPSLFVKEADTHTTIVESRTITSSPRTIQKIMIFYSDGTFEER